MRVSCSAPGKLVLLGEYAVLSGHPAVVAAVNRRAVVDLSPAGGDACSVVAPGLAGGPVSFAMRGSGTVARRRLRGSLPLVEALLAAMSRRGLLSLPFPPFSARLDTTSFFDPGGKGKLGLGSSAALTTALASALAVWTGRPAPLELAELVPLHRDVQGGRGSGVDVAAAVRGGVVEFRLDGAGEVAAARPLPLPGDLSLLFVWTGRPAGTGAFLARLEQALATDPAPVRAALGRLGSIAASAVLAARHDRTGEVLAAVDSFCDGLGELGRAAGLEILSAEHLRLRRAVAEAGGRYKPSGAGGGDCGVAFVPAGRGTAQVAAAIRAEGFALLDVEVDTSGLKLEVR